MSSIDTKDNKNLIIKKSNYWIYLSFQRKYTIIKKEILNGLEGKVNLYIILSKKEKVLIKIIL